MNVGSGLEAIDVGGSLPSFVLKNERDEEVDVATLAQDGALVLFAVPGAATPGCTRQACLFRDHAAAFAKLDATVVCISKDAPGKQERWRVKQRLPFGLLSDPGLELIGALGGKHPKTGRTVRGLYVFAKGGTLVERKVPVSIKDSHELALKALKHFNQSGRK